MSIKERIQAFIEYKGISVKRFEELCGLSNGYVSSMRKGFGTDKLNNVLSIFPDLNREWLLYGEGDMLNNDMPSQNFEEKSDTSTSVLLLPVSAQGGSLKEFFVSIKEADCERMVSPINGADFAIQVSGDSMSPEYPNGSRVLIKRINERAFIEWGKAYVLDTCNGIIIKILVPSEREDYVKCLSINQDPVYAPFEVCLQDVYGIYKVLLCMSMK